MKDYLVLLTAYNRWANGKILNFISAAGEDRAGMVQNSSFSTIRQTVLHLLDAQVIWFGRLHGISLLDWPGKDFKETTLAACTQLIDNSKKFENFAGKLTETELSNVISYKNIKGDQFESPVWQILAHVMNHGTYHRGQLITMLRVSGYTDLSSTDIIDYFRERQEIA